MCILHFKKTVQYQQYHTLHLTAAKKYQLDALYKIYSVGLDIYVS